MSKSQKRPSQRETLRTTNPWDGYLAKCVSVYLVFLMAVFVLYCKEGYIEYDLNKRNMFYWGGSLFVGTFLVIEFLSLGSAKAGEWKRLFSRMDLWLVGIIGSWLVGMVFATDRTAAFHGDEYRRVGFLYLMLGVLGSWIISRYVRWNRWLSRVMVAVGCIVFIWQVMNCYYIDPFNWTFGGQYHHLMSSLANLNQNACYDAMMLGIGMALFALAEKKEDKIGFGIFLFLGYMGGIGCTSSTFYLGLGTLFLVMLVYVLRHTEYLWSFWMEAALFGAAVLAHKLLYTLINDERVVLETMTKILFDTKTLFALGAVLAVGALLIWKAGKLLGRAGVVLSWVVLILAVAASAGLAVCVIYANTGHAGVEDGGFLSRFVMNDMSGNARGLIWRVSAGLFRQESFFHKLFGIGLNNYSLEIYKYYEADLYAVWGDSSVLADAHCVFLDMLVSSGVIGAVSYFGLSVHILVKAIRNAKKQPIAMCAVLGIAAWIAVGLINSNLNVTTQVYFGMLGVFWAMVRVLEDDEEVKKIIGIV